VHLRDKIGIIIHYYKIPTDRILIRIRMNSLSAIALNCLEYFLEDVPQIYKLDHPEVLIPELQLGQFDPELSPNMLCRILHYNYKKRKQVNVVVVLQHRCFNGIKK